MTRIEKIIITICVIAVIMVITWAKTIVDLEWKHIALLIFLAIVASIAVSLLVRIGKEHE